MVGSCSCVGAYLQWKVLSLSVGLLLLTILCAIVVLTVHRLRLRNVLIHVVDLMLVLWITAPFQRLAVDMIAGVMFVLSPVFVFRLLCFILRLQITSVLVAKVYLWATY